MGQTTENPWNTALKYQPKPIAILIKKQKTSFCVPCITISLWGLKPELQPPPGCRLQKGTACKSLFSLKLKI